MKTEKPTKTKSIVRSMKYTRGLQHLMSFHLDVQDHNGKIRTIQVPNDIGIRAMNLVIRETNRRKISKLQAVHEDIRRYYRRIFFWNKRKGKR